LGDHPRPNSPAGQRVDLDVEAGMLDAEDAIVLGETQIGGRDASSNQ
jgi:hypothetical protein